MIDVIAGVVGKVIDRVWPDQEKRDAAKLELFKLQQAGELQTLVSQLEINRAEAANPSVFVSGWRPGMGWVCVSAFAVNYLVAPLGTYAASLLGKQLQFPTMNLTDLMPVLLGMLGLAGYRTFEKVNGVAAK
jgi:holin (3TMs family)